MRRIPIIPEFGGWHLFISAQSLTHAESHALIRAYERNGTLPNRLTMYVDRTTCNMCRGELPALLKRLGVKRLDIYSGGSTTPITIFPTP